MLGGFQVEESQSGQGRGMASSGIARPDEVLRTTGGQQGRNNVEMGNGRFPFGNDTNGRTSQVSGVEKVAAEEQACHQQAIIGLDDSG